MLRARALQERGTSYVCAFCRHKLSPGDAQLRDRSFATGAASISSARVSSHSRCLSSLPFGVRALSTSSPLYRPDNNGPSQSGGFPSGGFNRGGFGAGLGGFGSFANKPPEPSTPGSTSTNTSNFDALLPHEREARQRMGLNQPKESAKTSKKDKKGNPAMDRSGSKKEQRDKREKNAKREKSDKRDKSDKRERRFEREPEEEIVTDASKPETIPLSSTLLADAFRMDRAPAPVATPASWLGGGLGSQQQQQQSESKPATASWGAFSARKVDTEIITKASATQASAQETKEAPKTDDGPGVWGQLRRSRKDTSTESEKKGGDFWDDLENRVSDIRSKRQTMRDEALQNRINQTSFNDSRSIRGLDQLAEEPRRKSRFDDEEGEEDYSRRGKKNKRQKNTRRREEEEEDYDDEATSRWEARQRRKAEKEAKRRAGEQIELQPVQISIPEYISVAHLAQALKFPVADFLRDLERMGFEDLTEDTIMTGDTAALVTMEYGLDPVIESGADLDLRPLPPPEDPSILPPRPPVVTIMGHVDHGKTTLLDWLRKSSIAAQEHGGITQHIGAFVVQMSTGKQITFLDTPGHAAFLSMRQRGANVTDIVVLVVAADDSVMPQTIEALKHATSAKVPIIVAINKIDKEDARIDQVKADLARHGVEIEDYGGDVQVVPVSGKTGQGMEDLEENIITLSEILDVRAEPDVMAEGWILESSVKQIGKVASVLVKRGTLRLGDYIVAGKSWAKIRGLRNEAGNEIPEAPPGTPVEILGWRDLPEAGEQVLQAPDEDKAKTAVEYRQEMAEREESSVQLAEQELRLREKAAAEEAAAAAEAEGTAVAESDEPSIKYQTFIIKADVAGSVEAVSGTVQEIGNNEVQTKILRQSVGAISEYDVDHAATSNSIIVNFNNPIPPHIRHRASENQVRIIDHSVIYHVHDEVKEALSELLPKAISHRVLGEAEVLQIFSINLKKRVNKNIAGCKIRNGVIKRTSLVKVLRRGEVIFDGKIDTLKHVKKDVMEMGKGTECGIGFENFQDLQADDQIQTYEIIQEKRYL